MLASPGLSGVVGWEGGELFWGVDRGLEDIMESEFLLRWPSLAGRGGGGEGLRRLNIRAS